MLFVSMTLVVLLSLLYLCKPRILSAMSDHAFDWLAEKAIGWSHKPPVNKIDTHHHVVPSFYAKGKQADCIMSKTNHAISNRRARG